MKLEERIIVAMGGRTIAPYHEVLRAVFPAEEYPRAYRRSTCGGPPGCAMAFGAAVRRMGGTTGTNFDEGGRMVYVPEKKESTLEPGVET